MDNATAEEERVESKASEEQPDEDKNPAAVALGRLSAKKDGKAWAKKQWSENAQKATTARWTKKKD